MSAAARLELRSLYENGPGISSYKGLDYSERFMRVANERAMPRQRLHGRGPFERELPKVVEQTSLGCSYYPRLPGTYQRL
jgi:hypothetical protein